MRKNATVVAYVVLLGLCTILLLSLGFLVHRLQGADSFRFQHPRALLLCLGAGVVMVVRLHLQKTRRGSFWFSRAQQMTQANLGRVARFARVPSVLRIVALLLIAVALARPQTHTAKMRTVEGIDIMFVLDLSKSMEEEDLQRNRLDAGQRTIREFLAKRAGKGDRIGLVVFAKEAMLQCPLTLDYRSLESLVASLKIGEVPALGTAIGDALGLALASLKRSESASKVVILLSDGDWNKAPYMDPYEARDLAVELGVRVFTVLLGRAKGSASKGLYAKTQYAVNPELLKEVAADTGGEYFNAGDDEQLSLSFEKIRKSLVRSEHRIVGTSNDLELYGLFVWPAFVLLLLELFLRMTRFRSFP